MSWFSNELNPPFKLKREFTSSYWWNDENLYTLYFLKYLIKKGKRQIAWFCYSNNILAGLQARLCVCLSSACCDRYLWAMAVTRVCRNPLSRLIFLLPVLHLNSSQHLYELCHSGCRCIWVVFCLFPYTFRTFLLQANFHTASNLWYLRLKAI